MGTQSLALLVSALSALAASWALSMRDSELYWFTLSILLIILLVVGLRRVFRAARPYRSGVRSARWGEGLFQAQALVLAIVMSGVIGAWLEREVAGRTLSTPLEGLAGPAGLLSALTVGVGLFLFLRRIPRKLLTLRLRGEVSANAAGDTIALTIGIGMGTSLGLIIGLIIGVITNLSDAARSIAIATAATLGYALPRLWLMRPAPHTGPCLWLVLAHPNTVLNWPQLVDRIARSHRNGSLTLVSPPNAVPFGEHLHMADRLGMLDSLFPRLEIEVRDWQRALPPADRWSGVVHRQVHPPVALMPMLLDSYLGPLDQVLLIASCEDDVQIWRDRLPVDRTRVLWVPPQSEGQAGARPDRVAGYPVIVMDAKTSGRINMQGWFSSQDKQATEAKAGGVFISYNQDSAGTSGRLADELSQRLPQAPIYRDVDVNEPGTNISELIERAMRACSVLLVVIGPRGLTKTGSFSHLEITAALKQADLRVIPVLVEGAQMPTPDELPDGLKPLTRHQAVELTDKRWDYDVGILADTLAGVLGLPSPQVPIQQEEPKTDAVGPGIYISYRREDTSGFANRLWDALRAQMGEARVTMDVTDIQLSIDIRRAIESMLAENDVVLVLIGPRWLHTSNADGSRRLDDPEDFNRMEIGGALARGMRVIPLLVSGASMPYEDELPDDLRRLARVNALEISNEYWEENIAQLVAVLREPPGESLP